MDQVLIDTILRLAAVYLSIGLVAVAVGVIAMVFVLLALRRGR